MQEFSRSPPTALFTLRLWQEPLDEQRSEWRGEIKNLATGEARYFRRWEEIAAIWATIGGQEIDATIETARTLRTCYTIFDVHGDPRADAVLAMAWEQLQRRVSTIDDPAHVEQFWQIEDHRFFRRLVGSD